MKILTITVTVFTLLTTQAFAELSKKSNGEIVTLSGKVSDAGPNTFMLNTKGNKVLVEMDDYNSWVADGLKLVNGDQVVVTGKVDQDFLEQKKVEAGSVYVKNIDAYFFANSADEEDVTYLSPTYSQISALPEGTHVDVQGKITQILGRDITVDTGIRKITVDTQGLGYNPLDKTGFTRLEVGDRVRVSGEIQDSIFSPKEVAAKFVTELPSVI